MTPGFVEVSSEPALFRIFWTSLLMTGKYISFEDSPTNTYLAGEPFSAISITGVGNYVVDEKEELLWLVQSLETF
jgi:hypothetical protein